MQGFLVVIWERYANKSLCDQTFGIERLGL